MGVQGFLPCIADVGVLARRFFQLALEDEYALQLSLTRLAPLAS